MQFFKLTEIIDGDTFAVSPHWTWNGRSGDRVWPKGYDAPEIGTLGAASASRRLHNLLSGRKIELRNAVRLDRGRIVCDVFVQGRNLADYFRSHRT